jgi:hypothetical protein
MLEASIAEAEASGGGVLNPDRESPEFLGLLFKLTGDLVESS